MARALIFDFDGVVADSEVLANTVLAEAVSELGVATTLEDSYRLYMGKRFADIVATLEAATGRPLPPAFAADVQARTLARLRRDLRPVAGVSGYIGAFAHLRRAIASSSSPDRLALCLDVLGMSALFGDHVYSASMVERGKPHPDIFLLAASRIGVAPVDCIVIEDSASGVVAARAAGMRVIGLLAASHVRSDHGRRLAEAGVDALARDFAEAEALTRRMLADA